MEKAKKKNQRKKDEDNEDEISQKLPVLRDETRHGVSAILFFILTIFLGASAFGAGGPAGNFSYSVLEKLFGAGFFLLPISSFIAGISFLRSLRPNMISSTLIGGTMFLLSSLGLVNTILSSATGGEINGGIVGSLAAKPFVSLFDSTIGSIALGAIMIISVLIIFDTHISLEPYLFGKRLFEIKNEEEDDQEEDKTDTKETEEDLSNLEAGAATSAKPSEKKETSNATEPPIDKKTVSEKIAGIFANKPARRVKNEFLPPPLSLLERDTGKPIVGDIKANANIIKRTLLNFGIDVEMDEISIGPSVTRYSLKPAEGVKLSKIVALQNDLSLALAAHPIRIEAPIPGKSLVGIEIPNSSKTTVGLGTLLAAKKFQESDAPLLVPLGKGVTGTPYFSDIARAPHMLIAGATGSGKSVTIHTIIASLLYRNPPENLRLILIDPKRVELTLYNGIPHLLTPVITEPKKAILILKWAAKEMERRYNVLEAHAVRDIFSYHKNIYDPQANNNDIKEENLPERMPYIVIVIDELADIMSAYPRELEAGIVRLAQMSRAVGIHLVLSTQRPSVEIITGLIKANIPSRIALQVPSQIDSRTILDMPGAEKLLGAGDMLYISGDTSKPIRIQSGYISENEVKKLVKYLIEKHKEDVIDQINISNSKDLENAIDQEGDLDSIEDDFDSDEDDEMYEAARELVISTRKASASFLQRKLKLGYARAARMIDMLEERGVIGPGDGAKSREIYGEEPSNDYGRARVLEEENGKEEPGRIIS